MQNLQSADSTLLMSMTTPITTSAFVVPKTGRTPDALPGVSVVVPLLNEQESIPGLVAEIHTEMSKICTFEIVLVDDGSRDHTRAVCLDLATRFTGLRVIGHARPAGQSAAVHSGVLAARGAVIATLDGDGQNPPENLPRLLAPLLAQPKGPGPRSGPCLGLVAGQRVGRKDSLSKRLASGLANRLRMALLSDNTRDTGCGLKAFRRDAYLALPFFNHQHRYLPALFARDGWGVALIDVSHAARQHGQSKYGNLSRALVGISDLAGVAWLIRRRKTGHPVEIRDALPDLPVGAGPESLPAKETV